VKFGVTDRAPLKRLDMLRWPTPCLIEARDGVGRGASVPPPAMACSAIVLRFRTHTVVLDSSSIDILLVIPV
jgi:hypothetical protein